MRGLIKTIFILPAVLALASCYGIEKENYKQLAGIEIDLEDGARLYTALLEPLVVDIDVRSANDNELTYEWAVGPIDKEKGFPIMTDTTFISDRKDLDYAFNRIGDFVLRLKVDNGETIVFRYYNLRVTTGVDEGIVVLSADDRDDGYLSFIKTRTPDEIRDGSREFWLDVVSEMNPDYALKHPNDMYLSYSSEYDAASLIVILSDGDGSIIKMDPRTFLVAARNKLGDYGAGLKPLRIVGEATTLSKALFDAYAAYILGSDGNLYRYDLGGDILAIRTDCLGLNLTHAYEFRQEYGITHDRNYYFRSGNLIVHPASMTRGVFSADLDAYDVDIINIGAQRNYSAFQIVARSRENGEICHFSCGLSILMGISVAPPLPSYDEPNLCIDENSIVLASRQTDKAIYNFNDNIYEWEVTNNNNPRISNLPVALDPPLPAGEHIVTIGINGDPKDGASAENHLYIATYNDSRAGETKGSLYVYEIPEYKLVKAYEGMFYKPLKVFYKYPISL